MAFLIAFIPALGVYLVSVHTSSRGLTIVTAICAALLGIVTGNPAFTFYDLTFVGVALLLGLLRAKDADHGRMKRLQQEDRNRGHGAADQVRRVESEEQSAADREARSKAGYEARRLAAIQELQAKMLAEAKAKRRWNDR